MLSRIAKCCTHGDGSSPMDQRWYRTFATLLLLLFLEAFVITSVYKLLLTGIALPLSISTAPNISESALPPAYAFWLTGNTSFFEVATTNQTDMNMSSPTYGYWLPPAGALAFPFAISNTHGSAHSRLSSSLSLLRMRKCMRSTCGMCERAE